MFSKGIDSISLEDILNKVSEIDILYYYLSINKVPCVINSPLRKDKRPSFGIYSPNGSKICYIDYSTKDKGGLFDLLSLLWGCSYKETLLRINKDIPKISSVLFVIYTIFFSKFTKEIFKLLAEPSCLCCRFSEHNFHIFF